MGYLDGFLITVKKTFAKGSQSGRVVTSEYAKDQGGKYPRPVRRHGRHVAQPVRRWPVLVERHDQKESTPIGSSESASASSCGVTCGFSSEGERGSSCTCW